MSQEGKHSLRLKVKGRNRSQKRARRRQVEEESLMVVLSREDALCRSKCIVDVNQIATR